MIVPSNASNAANETIANATNATENATAAAANATNATAANATNAANETVANATNETVGNLTNQTGAANQTVVPVNSTNLWLDDYDSLTTPEVIANLSQRGIYQPFLQWYTFYFGNNGIAVKWFSNEGSLGLSGTRRNLQGTQ